MDKIEPRPPRIERTLQLVGNMQAGSLLDIGCGDGGFAVLFGDALGATKRHGIEISPEAAETANRKGIGTIVADVGSEGIAFDDESFDVVIALEIIEHLTDPGAFLTEVHRVLKPKGTLVVSTPNIASWHSRLHLALGYQPYSIPIGATTPFIGNFLRSGKVKRDTEHHLVSGNGGAVHIQFFTLRSLKELMKLSGFDVKTAMGSPDMPSSPIPLILRLFVSLAEAMTSRFSAGMASTIIVKGTKK